MVVQVVRFQLANATKQPLNKVLPGKITANQPLLQNRQVFGRLTPMSKRNMAKSLE
jgi:hypothetical protein